MKTLVWRSIDPATVARHEGTMDAKTGVPSTARISDYQTAGEKRAYALGHVAFWSEKTCAALSNS